ncbi:MAG: hypothetical protein NTW03_16190, partial [Verrucomicrobia bacterium]|nr:hypothetical protein [Verrucomicrobiota bacterium]
MEPSARVRRRTPKITPPTSTTAMPQSKNRVFQRKPVKKMYQNAKPSMVRRATPIVIGSMNGVSRARSQRTAARAMTTITMGICQRMGRGRS